MIYIGQPSTELPFITIMEWDNFIDSINFNNAYLDNIGYRFPRPVIPPHYNPNTLQYSDHFFVKQRNGVTLSSDTRPANLTIEITCFTERTDLYLRLHKVFQNVNAWDDLHKRNLKMGWDFENDRYIDYPEL